MKRYFAYLSMVLLATSLFAWPVRIQSWKIDEDIKNINNLGISIDYVNRQTGVINCYVRDAAEQYKLLSIGLEATRFPDLAKEYAQQLWEETKDTRDPMRSYYTLAEYQTFMQTTAATYPNLCQLVQFGTSTQNRPLYMMKISDNVSIDENEPELKYVGSIHGDEVVGYDLMIRLIQLLTSQYATNTRISNIVNNTEIWICPMFNPDGNALVQRYNANGVDLNRNFPMPTGVLHPDGSTWQAETQAMMDFSNAHDFDLSIGFHGGALVVNYPWDYTYTLAPDDALLREMSLTYSRENAPMYASTEFPQGITNGAAWYITTGCMQDWNYGLTDCIELTTEVSAIKWPNASTLDTFWAQNQESLLKYLEFAQNGVKGIVTDTSGTPISATITIVGNSKIELTDLPIGDYHRLLLPGTYQVNASATGYISQTVSVTVPTTGAVTQNFSLATASITSFEGQVRSPMGVPVANASVVVSTSPITTVQTNASGIFNLSNIFEGNYQISITASGFAAFNQNLAILQGTMRNIFVLGAPLFSDDFESGMGNWTATGSWGIVSNGGSNVLTDSPAGNYSNNQNRTVRTTNPIPLQNVSNPGLSFSCKYALEAGYDFVYVEASSNNSTWVELGSFTGTQSTYQNNYFSLNAFAGSNLYLRFRLSTDSSQNADGIYIDNVQVSGNSSNNAIYGDVTGDAIVNYTDLEAVNAYTIGLNSLPTIDPLPWDTFRVTNADVDNDGNVDPFDCYQLLKYLTQTDYLLPVQSGITEPSDNPGISFSYADGSLAFNFTNPELLHSLKFSTSPADIFQVIHNGFIENGFYLQDFNSENESYAFAHVNTTFGSLNVVFEPNPENFTLQYSLNGVAGSAFIDVSSANAEVIIPQMQTALLPNYPNPFNPSTTLSFSLSEPTQTVSLEIYNLKGQLIKSLVSADLPAGRHTASWNGIDNNGQAVSSGIYFSRLHTPTFTQTRKMLLSK
jgi:hypothetical protein